MGEVWNENESRKKHGQSLKRWLVTVSFLLFTVFLVVIVATSHCRTISNF